MTLPLDGNYVLTGPPGSGKTNLVLLRATYLLRAGLKNVVVLTYGRVISEFILTGTTSLDRSHIMTLNKWARGILKECDVVVALPTDVGELTRALISELSKLGARGDLPQYDAILLDEAQDYPLEAVPAFRAATPRLFVAGDERQRLYEARGTMAAFSSMADETIILPTHYRNGKRICDVASSIDNIDYRSNSAYDETLASSVSVDCLPLAQQSQLAIDRLKQQMLAFPDELLGVMVPLVADLREVVEALHNSSLAGDCQFQTAEEGMSAFQPDKRIIVTSVHSVKGLEFRAAHILAADGFNHFPPFNRRSSALTAVTRAKTSLSVYHEAPLANWFATALQRGMPPLPPPNPASVFESL